MYLVKCPKMRRGILCWIPNCGPRAAQPADVCQQSARHNDMREDIDIRHQGSPEERGLGAHCTRALVWQEAAAQRLNSSRTTQSRQLFPPRLIAAGEVCLSLL